MQTLKNDILSICVKSKGAELTSIKKLSTNKEYMWHADEAYWGRHSPILFPIVGCLKDNEYIYNNKTYSLHRHGFARILEFELVDKTDTTLTYLLKSNETTLEMYPFQFELYIKYTLNDTTVTVSYEVKNINDKTMYFSIGAHPAFNCEIDKGNKYLEFKENETLKSYLVNVQEGLIKRDTIDILNNEKELLLHYDLFKADALVFDDVKCKTVTIRDDITHDKITVKFDGFPFLGIWTPCAPFLCIEPWYGIADFEDSNKKLEDKVGIQKLETNGIFKCSYDITI